MDLQVQWNLAAKYFEKCGIDETEQNKCKLVNHWTSFQTAALHFLVCLRSGECCLAEKTVQSKNLKLATNLVGNGFTAVEQRQLSLQTGILKPQLVLAEVKSKAALHLEEN